MIPHFIDKSKIPHKPGVYIYYDQSDIVLYVGKAIDLYSRVASYFNKDVLPKTRVLVSRIAYLNTIIVESELEALILEANLIKKYKPPFNVKLVDDKDYLYIMVTKESFPKVTTARRADLKKAKYFFGPFPSARTVKTTLKTLRKVFPWCSNPPKGAKGRPCFYYHLKLCMGPCAGMVGLDEYNRMIKRFVKFMSAGKSELIDELTVEMQQLSGEQKYEEASVIKRIIDGINYITQSNRTKAYLENPNFLEDQRNEALKDLQKDLGLKNIPLRIECYDISNIGGVDATGSMVVLTNGEIDKSQYRKFKIRLSGKPNDVGMHKEMMRRRLKHLEWSKPDLIIIDGGRGQVRGSYSEIVKVYHDVPVLGLAKRMEWLYPPEGEVIKLPRRTLSLRLLQQIRDESHRFAITYHRTIRDKMVFRR